MFFSMIEGGRGEFVVGAGMRDKTYFSKAEKYSRQNAVWFRRFLRDFVFLPFVERFSGALARLPFAEVRVQWDSA